MSIKDRNGLYCPRGEIYQVALFQKLTLLEMENFDKKKKEKSLLQKKKKKKRKKRY